MKSGQVTVPWSRSSFGRFSRLSPGSRCRCSKDCRCSGNFRCSEDFRCSTEEVFGSSFTEYWVSVDFARERRSAFRRCDSALISSFYKKQKSIFINCDKAAQNSIYLKPTLKSETCICDDSISFIDQINKRRQFKTVSWQCQ